MKNNTNSSRYAKLLSYSKSFIVVFSFVFFVLLFEYYTDSSVHFLYPTQLYLKVKSIVNYDKEAKNSKPPNPNNIRPPPHIVMFVADDLGWNDISWHNPIIKSPNLEKLAKDGITLEQHYGQHICTPSRGALLTGLYPIHNGLHRHAGGALRPETPHGMMTSVPTIAEKLKRRGYSTHIIGKWHLGFCKPAYLPTKRGFQHHYGFWGGAQDYYSHEVHHAYDFRQDLKVKPAAKGTYSTTLFQKKAIETISRHNQSNPLFLFIPFQSVHDPLQVPKRFDIYRNKVNDKKRAIFLGMVTAMDNAVGHIKKSLKQHGMLENTLFIFMSDNGAAPQNSGSNWPLRGGKHTLYEGGTKVPAFVSGLGLKPRIESRMFHITDWYPTILGAVDPLEKDDRLDGVNQWEALKDESLPWPRSSMIYNIDDITKKNPDPIAAIRVNNWKYIWRETGAWNGWYFPSEEKMSSHSRDDWDGFRWKNGKKKGWFPINNTTKHGRIGVKNLLFDLSNDPSEKVNLAQKYPQKVLELKNLIKAHAKTIKKVKDSNYERTGSPHNGVWTTGWC